MERIWDAFIKKEELESAPGVTDENLVRALTLSTYAAYIREMIDMEINICPEEVSEQIESVMADIYMTQTYAFEGRYPEPEEISAFLRLPDNAEARKNLTWLCVHSTRETWSETEKRLSEMLPVSELGKIDWDSEERRENAEKWARRFEQEGYVEL